MPALRSSSQVRWDSETPRLISSGHSPRGYESSDLCRRRAASRREQLSAHRKACFERSSFLDGRSGSAGTDFVKGSAHQRWFLGIVFGCRVGKVSHIAPLPSVLSFHLGFSWGTPESSQQCLGTMFGRTAVCLNAAERYAHECKTRLLSLK